jgi:hypothetical protein
MMAGQAVFERALNELKERRMAPAVWARALAEADGDKHKAVAIYIKYRVEQIENAPAQAAQLAGSARPGMPSVPPPVNPVRGNPPPLPTTAVGSMQPAYNSSYSGTPPPIPQAGVRVPPSPAPLMHSAVPPQLPRPDYLQNRGNSDLTVMMGDEGEELPRTGLTCARTRFRARLLDWSIIWVLQITIIMAMHYSPAANGGESTTTAVTITWIDSFISNALMLGLDTLTYAVFGNSIGKALYSVEVRSQGRRIGGGRYALRNLAMWVLGLGCSLPFLNLATVVWQYFRLKNGKQAIYDDLLDMQTVCREDRPGRRWLGDAILVLFAVAGTILYAVSLQFGQQ